MRKRAILILAGAMLLAGCTAGLDTKVGQYNINGDLHTVAFIEGRGYYAGTLQTINTYDSKGKLETNNSFGSNGPLSSFVQGGLAGAEMGAGIGAGLAAQGAANVVQQGGGAVQSQGQGIKSSIKNTNFQAQGQSQKAYGGTGIGIGGQGGSSTIQKGAVTNNVDVF